MTSEVARGWCWCQVHLPERGPGLQPVPLRSRDRHEVGTTHHPPSEELLLKTAPAAAAVVVVLFRPGFRYRNFGGFVMQMGGIVQLNGCKQAARGMPRGVSV